MKKYSVLRHDWDNYNSYLLTVLNQIFDSEGNFEFNTLIGNIKHELDEVMYPIIEHVLQDATNEF